MAATVSVALHLQVAFAPRGADSPSLFRPPPVPIRSSPFARPPPAMRPRVALTAQEYVPLAAPTGQPRALQPTAQPFMPAALRAASETPPPPPPPAAPKGDPWTTTAKGVRCYSPDAFAGLQNEQDCPSDALEALVATLAAGCTGGWVPLRRADSGCGDDVRGGLFSGRSGKQRPERLVQHKVMSVLSRVTPAKYEELKAELLALPLRQADEAQLNAVVEVFFNKAVQEDKFSSLYADLVQSIFDVANEEAALTAPSTPMTPSSPFTAAYAEKTSTLAKNLRFALLTRCQTEFERPYRLTPTEVCDAEGRPLPAEAISERKYVLKKRLCGNIRFVGELYRCGIVTDRVITHILSKLLEQAAHTGTAYEGDSSDDLLEVFVTLMNTVGAKYESKCPRQVENFIAVARSESDRQTTTRIRFLLMNLVDLAERNWVEAAPGTAPQTPASARQNSFTSKHASATQSPVTPFASAKKTDTSRTAKARSAAPALPAVASSGSRSGGMPSRSNTNSQSFGNVLSMDSGNSSGSPSVPTSPAKTRGVRAGKKAQPSPLSETFLDRAKSPAQSLPPSNTVGTLAVLLPSVPANLVDAALKPVLAEASERAQKLFAISTEVKTLCEHLSTMEREPGSPTGAGDATAIRAHLLRNYVLDIVTIRRKAPQRASLSTLVRLLSECPVVDNNAGNPTLAAPWFTAETASSAVIDTIHTAVGDGVFDDCPMFFANVLELELPAGSADAVMPPGTVAATLCDAIAEAAAEDAIDGEAHKVGLRKAVSQLASPAVRTTVEKVLREHRMYDA
jgi:hypothetical protein